MAVVRRVLVLLLVALCSPSVVAAEPKPFTHEETAQNAARYEAYLKKNFKAEGRGASYWRKQAEGLVAKADHRGAASAFATATVVDAQDARSWLGLARALRASQPTSNDDRFNLAYNASSAAYIAYLRASRPDTKAAALAVLAEALKERAYWRPALDAFKASLALAESKEVRASYEALAAEQGFRIVDYTIDADAASPRVCIQFSEQLATGSVDFAKFISVDGKDPAAVSLEDGQLCVDGLLHGQRYAVSVRAGLPSAVDETLLKTADLSVYVRDRSAQVRFSGRSYVLPVAGQQGIPVTTVNTDKVDIEVFRIGDRGLAKSIYDGDLERQISGEEMGDLRERDGVSVWKGELPVKQRLNEEISTAVPIGEAIGKLQPGVYAMVAEPSGVEKDYWEQRATQWFIVSDLGLTALTGDDGIHAFVRSITSTTAVAGSTVRLLARNSEELGTATTDAAGYARFEAGLTRGEGGAQPALLVAESAAGDYAFLDLSTGAFDLSDRGVSGRTAPGPLDGYVYTERGVYRSGETVHIAALLRDRNGAATPGIPLTLSVLRPDGVVHLDAAMPDQGLGGRTTDLVLSAGAMTGTWKVRVFTDPDQDPVGETSFLVEDYVPERLDLVLTPASESLRPGETGTIKAEGRYLYGPPAGNLAVEGEVVVERSASGLAGFAGYAFGLDEDKINPVRASLQALPNTDADGRATLPVALPELPKTGQMLQARVLLRLREPSGRTIERSVTLPIMPGKDVIGIKSLADGELAGNSIAEFDVMMVGSDGKPKAAKGLTWELQSVERRYQWYGRNGSWNYEPITYTKRVDGGTVDVDGVKPARISHPVEWGEYRLEVVSPDPTGPASSTLVYAGWYGAQTADTPEALEIAFDKESYAPGDVAKVSIKPQGAGRALVTVLREGLLASKEIDVPAGGTTVELPVDASWLPGAYVAATLYRPIDIAAKRMPGRAIGIAWLPLDTKSRELAITMDLPAKVASASTLKIPVSLAGLAPGEEARLTIAAVDVGILNLTRYQTPAPDDWYYGQRRLGIEIRDLYGRLIDGMRAEKGALKQGGDAAALEPIGAPPTSEPVALFSGLVAAGPDGKAEVSFTLPEFNGSLKVMAVAWSASKLGHAEKEVIVRDPVALLVSGPRFLTIGDEAQVMLDLHNVEGPEASYRLLVEATDGLGVKSTPVDGELALKPNERKLQTVAVKATGLGTTSYAVRLTGPAGIDVARAFALEVKPAASDVRRTTSQSLAAKSGKLTVSDAVLGDLIPGTARITLSVGAASGLDVPGLLLALDRYPYGCAEQTTSRALPLLYLNSVAAAAGITGEDKAKERIEKAIARLFEMQDSTGAFGLWSPGNGDLWLSAYVTDFLTRAKEQGHPVPVRPFNQALDRLQNAVAFASDFEQGGEDIAYALYVLARNSRAPVGDLRYYADTRIDRFSTPLAQAQIAAALSLYGDKERAERTFDTALAAFEREASKELRQDYGSALRDGAATLTLVAETGIRTAASLRLTSLLSQLKANRSYTSTQENAWMLLAARALMQDTKTVALDVGGKPFTGMLIRSLTAAELTAAPLAVANKSEIPVEAIVTVTGDSATPEPAVANGFTVERTFYALDGSEVDLAANPRLEQNARLLVVLKVANTDGVGGRVLLVDRLPAGLEIENPRLVEGGSLANLPWLNATSTPEHTEFRDDRFVAAFNLGGGQSTEDGEGAQTGDLTLAYVVRAVSPGRYLHPAASVEDMYRPERYARTAASQLEVFAKP